MFLFVAMATRVMGGMNFFKNFCRASPKEHSCRVSSRLAQWFRRCLTFSSIYTHFNKLKRKAEEKSFRKTLSKKVKWAISPFSTMFFYAICIFKSFNSHITVVICSFLDFETVSKWCTREWVKEVVEGCQTTNARCWTQCDQNSSTWALCAQVS